MIDGVTILASEVVMKPALWVDIVGWVCVGGLIFVMFIAVIGFIFDSIKMFVYAGAAFIVFAITGISLGIIGITFITVPDYTKYEVVLDDSVSMNEFMNTYEVLEQRGQIYVVKEIEE